MEFENEKSASTAVFKLDQTDFMERKITIAISEPPSHDKNLTSNPTSSSSMKITAPQHHQSHPHHNDGMQHQQQQLKKFIPRPDQKSRLSFIPASVQKAVISKETPTPKEPAKSNDDFRKMFKK